MEHSDQIVLHEIAIMIVGKAHNPSILNPHFLQHNSIVSKKMRPADGTMDVVSTPMVARIAYKDGLVIVGDQQRIVFTEPVSDKPLGEIICPNAAKAYLRAVPHVLYTAVGVNLEGHLHVSAGTPPPRPATLLQDGGWTEFKGVSPSAEIELKYPMKRKTATVGVEVTDLDTPVNIKNALVFRGNFHRAIGEAEQDSFQQAISAVEEWEDDLKEFRQLAEQIAGEMK